MRTLAYLGLLGIHCVGAAAHATGMFFGGSLAGEARVVVTIASPVPDAAETELRELLPNVGFQATNGAIDGWSAVGAGDPLLSEAHDFGAAIETGADASPPPACSDSFDNDGDGRTDFPDDPGCITPGSVTEQPRCQDGIDTDGDGAIDFDGGASLNGGVPLGAPDPECEGAPWRYVERP
jgi:hypothetical protein